MPTSTLLPSLSDLTSTAITEYGLYEYLQADVRPTFLVSLLAPDDLGQSVGTSLAFCNTSLSNNHFLLDKITRVLIGVSAGEDHDYNEASDFLSWILGNAQSPIWFGDALWSATDIDSTWRIISGIHLPRETSSSKLAVKHVNYQQSNAGHKLIKPHVTNGQSRRHISEKHESVKTQSGHTEVHHSETLLSSVAEPSVHQRQMQSFNWTTTELGPIATWPHTLYQTVKLVLACPLAAYVYWGPSRNAIWNDAGIMMLRGFDVTPGNSAYNVFEAFWEARYEPLCREVERTGRTLSVTKNPGPLVERDGGLRETFWTYVYMPVLDDNGDARGVCGLINDVTTEVLMKGRIDTLLKLNEAMGTATNLSSFWQVILAELERNSADIPLAAVYSMGSEAMIDRFTGLDKQQEWHTSSSANFHDGTHPVGKWILEGKIGFPNEHVCVPSEMAFHGTDGLSAVFREAMMKPKMGDALLCTENGTLPADFLIGCEDRGLGFECTQLVACPLQRPSGGVIAWLVLGVNPRRTFDDEYNRFTRLLSRQIESKLVLVLTLEREKKMALQSAGEAAHQQKNLSLQLQQQRREAEQSHSRFFKFAKQAPVGVYIVGSEGEIKFCNDAWCKIFDTVPGIAVPKPWLERVHPEDLDEMNHQWDRFLEGFVQDRFEWRALRPGSTSFDSEDDIIYLESWGFPEIADDGTLKSITCLITDVSIHKAYQREQAEKLKNALEAKRAQEYFMDMVSHEMRNPLNSIIQCAEEASQLIEKLDDKISVKDGTSAVFEDIRDMVNTIIYCGAHQKQLINDVLTLSKLNSNLLVVYPVEVHPATLLNQAIRIFGSEIRASDIEVITSVEISVDSDAKPSAIMADPSRITQILINLISNAIKFMKEREERKLHITAHISRERQSIGALRYIPSGNNLADPTSGDEWGTGEPVYLYFSVRDTGPGLSDPEMSSLFSRFQQASPRTHVAYGGSGLGLFISRELTELHGGEIGISSQVDQGSTFVFYVKGRRHTCQPEVLRPDSSSCTMLQHRKKRSDFDHKIPVTTPSLGSDPLSQPDSPPALHVLVVEDNDINRRILERQLRKLGYQVTTAIHGEAALSVLQTSTWWQGSQLHKDARPSESNDERPHLSVILCDLEMPVMDGVTCVRRIRQWQQEGLLHDNIPVIALTGNARAETTLLADGSGFDHVISKPYSLMGLVKQISIHTGNADRVSTG